MKIRIFIIISICILNFDSLIAQDAPILSGFNCNFNREFDRSILFGERLCVTICSTDSNENDSVFIKANILPKDATFSILNKGDINQNARICFNPKDKPTKAIDTFKIVLRAYNHSDFSGDFTEQTYFIYVNKLLEFDFEAINTKCGEVAIRAWPTNDVEVKGWLFLIGSKGLYSNNIDTGTALFKNIQSETVNIRVSANSGNGHNPLKEKEFDVKLGSPFWTNSYELIQCKTSSAIVDLDDFKRPKVTYNWLGFNDNTAKKEFKRTNDTTYKIRGQIENCIDTLTIKHNVLDLKQSFSKSIKSGSAPVEVEFDILGQTDADLFYFDFNNGKSEIARKLSFPLSFQYDLVGTYQATVICYKKGLSSCSDTFKFNAINVYPTSVEDLTSIIEIYPNPVNSILNIKSETTIQSISIYSIDGKDILKRNAPFTSHINVSELEKGIYLLKMITEKGIYQIQFVKE